jgi:replicative DNA helicase
MMLYRPEYYEQTDENSNKAQLILAKQRNGPTGTVDLMFFNETMRFENPSPSIAEPMAPQVS